MIQAEKTGLEIDTFVVYTDNETWAGSIHPHQALASYRRATGIPARLVVVGMAATEFSIADPSDAGMLDIAGFDGAVPSMIGDFSRGL
jgi:60 kDa SS-A/Ro ribonucleoprotein